MGDRALFVLALRAGDVLRDREVERMIPSNNSVVSMIPTLSASWPSHSIARAIFCRFNSETVITCAERSPRTLSVTLMTAKVIRRASPTLPSSSFFVNPIDWSSARHQSSTSSPSRRRPARSLQRYSPPYHSAVPAGGHQRPAVRRKGFMECDAETGGSICLDACELHHLAPFLGFVGDEFPEFSGGHK